jgi:NifB/MoaA-like Fe-S oxidoreductase
MKGTLVTGKLFSPSLQRCIEEFNRKFGSCLQVRRIESRFMGRKITVAGLLAGQDIVTALKGRDLGDFVIVPGEAMSRENSVFVDDLTLTDLAKKLGLPVYSSGPTVQSFFKLLFEKL